MKLFSLKTFPVQNKTVLVRVNFDVPLKSGKVMNNWRILSAIPTIKFLQKQNCKIILLTHVGRPKGKHTKEFSTKQLLKELKKHFPQTKITYTNDCIGKHVKAIIEKAKPKQIILLENVRFYKEERSNNPVFAHALANLADVYINEAFSNSHRKHASMHAITKFIPSLPGLSLEKEIHYLQKALQPKRPAIWILGGAKLDKIPPINQALKKADYILVGGALAFAFMKARGFPIGMSKTDVQSFRIARKILKKRNARKIILPPDFITTEKFSARAKTTTTKANQFTNRQIGLDLGPETIKLFKQKLRTAHTIIWNGPLGYYEWTPFATATKTIGRFLTTLTATTICGGGETADAVTKFHLEHKLSHVSTGGGASLLLLSGKPLPAIIALEKNYKRFKKLARRDPNLFA